MGVWANAGRSLQRPPSADPKTREKATHKKDEAV
jgi:hypothetical protein